MAELVLRSDGWKSNSIKVGLSTELHWKCRHNTFLISACFTPTSLGNRWLRGQRSHESKSLEVASYPKRKEKDSWHFFKILECSNHFLGQSATKSSSSSKKPTVTLIIANEHHELMHVAKSQGRCTTSSLLQSDRPCLLIHERD